MKKLLFSLLLFPSLAYAQKFELGLGAGISTNVKPSNNMYFKGDKMTINYAATLQAFYNISDYLQAGIEVRALGLSSKSDKAYVYYDGRTIGDDDKRFVYGKNVFAPSAVVNGKLPLKNGYLYGGAALGYGVARHDSKKLSANESYRAPDGGKGVVWGLQIGYVQGITKHLAITAEGALRRYNLKYDTNASSSDPMQDLHYNVAAYALTVGLRYQLFTSETKEKERQDLMNSEETTE